MSRQSQATEAAAYWLNQYREIQRSEGLTLEAEDDLARAQGRAWRRYVKACKIAGITPESMDSPDLGAAW